MSTGKSALLIGATGAVGKPLLRELLASQQFSRVGEYGRRVTSEDKLGEGFARDKLEQKVINFEKLDEAGLKEGKWDVVFITLGTTKAEAGGAEAFKRIDKEYVVNAARAAKTDDPAHEQRVVYCSSAGADASSSFFYPKSKGETENALASLGYKDAIIFRPGFLANANRDKSRLIESVAGGIVKVMSYVSSSVEINVSVLASAMMKAGALGSAALPADVAPRKAGPAETPFTLINNKGALALGKASL